MERKYQVFISSTYIDLVAERDEVIKQILKNFHFPIGMEMFAASDKKQWQIIEKTISSSDIYILIVGYRYGTIDSDTGKSYTEMEYDYAKQHGKRVIIFLKKDPDFEEEVRDLEELNAQQQLFGDDKKRLEHIYNNLYDRNQDNIGRFRRKVTVTFANIFTRNIDVQAALKNEISEIPTGGWVQQQRIRWHFLRQRNFFILLVILAATLCAVYKMSGVGLIGNQLKSEEAQLFHSPRKNAQMEFARVIPDDESLASETDLAQTFRSTTDSFWIITNALKLFYDFQTTIDSAVKRGVYFHIVLIDTATENYGGLNVAQIYKPDSLKAKNHREQMFIQLKVVLGLLKETKEKIASQHYKGDVEVRFYSRPVFYQMWIKDPADNGNTGIAHICIPNYDNLKPIFRISQTSSSRLFDHLTDEFRKFWSNSRPVQL